jgi:hypothetical protein
MRRSLAILAVLATVLAGCDGGDDDEVSERERTIHTEVTSSPSGLPVTVDVSGTQVDGITPLARDVSVTVTCRRAAPGLDRCLISGSAEVKGDDPFDRLGKRVTICLTDFGRRECAEGQHGLAFVFFDVLV